MTKTRWGSLLVALLLIACVLPAAAQAEQCPNEQLRREANSVQLPDCRAYELVTPPFKNGVAVYMGLGSQASTSGDGVTLGATGVFAGAKGSALVLDYLSSRTPSGWSTQGLEIPQLNIGNIMDGPTQGVSADLSHTFLGSLMALAPGAVQGQVNLYLQDNSTGQLEFIGTAPEYQAQIEINDPNNFIVLGGTADYSHVVFTFRPALTPDAVAGYSNIYDFTNGQLHLISRLPDGSVASNAVTAVYEGTAGEKPHPISADGSKFFFNAGGVLYVRENDTTTVPISVSQRAEDAGTLHGGVFVGASADGSIVYFLSPSNLTEASDTQALYSLYRYDFSTGLLTDLTVSSAPSDAETGPQVQRVFQVTPDGSYVYFSARGALAPGATTSTSNEVNFYVWHEGQGTRLIARAFSYYTTAQGSPNGQHFAFTAESALSSYHCGGCIRLFDYDYATAQLRCVSCDPSGAPPVGFVQVGGLPNGPGVGRYHPNFVLDNGMVYFESLSPLVPQDTNGQYDVYEWQDGRLSLISPGTGEQLSKFSDASPDGKNVFFKTGKQLVGQDIDGTVDMYDARIGGGFPAPVVAAPCTGTGCQGVPSAPPIFATPPSVTFNGVGNFEAAPKPVTKSKRVSLSRAQKLAAALRTCKRGPKKKRATCEARARKKYGKAAGARTTKSRVTKSDRRGN